MSAATDALVQNIADQTRVYRRLLDLTQAQIAAIKVQDVRAVHALLAEIEMTMLERARVDQRRSACIAAVAKEHGVRFDEVTANFLASISEDGAAQAIRDASRELGGIVRELDGSVEVSRRLLENELRVIDTLVKGMTREARPNPIYARGGQQDFNVRVKLLDMQV